MKISNIGQVESPLGVAKQQLVKFNGVLMSNFLLHLKKTNFYFNFRNKNLYKVLLKMVKKKPLR
jgi:transposase-like protein